MGARSGREGALFDERLFAAIVTVAFLLVTVPVALHHEMWRDELQSWLVARDSSSLGNLFHRLRYEGHPALWYLLLRPISRVVTDARWVQVVSLVLGASSVYLFARLAPFSRLNRVLFAFGYFVVYGYTIIARSYVLEMLLLLGICALLTRPRPRLFAAGMLMLLAANTSIYGTILVIALVCGVVAQALFLRGERQSWPRCMRQVATIVLPAALGIVLAIVQVRTPPDASFRGNGPVVSSRPRAFDLYRLTPVWRAYVPIPPSGSVGDIGGRRDFLANRSRKGTALAIALSAVMVGLAAYLMRRSALALVFFLTATGGIMLFSLTIFVGGLYHHGHLFLALIMGLWIAAEARGAAFGPNAPPIARRGAPRTVGSSSWLERNSEAGIAALLTLQVAGGAVRVVGDYRYPYSGGMAAAAYLRNHGLASSRIVVYPCPYGTTIAGYLGRSIYSLDRGRITFCPLDVPPISLDGDAQILAATRSCCVRPGSPVTLLTRRELTEREPDLIVRPLAQFDTAIVGERYYIYSVRSASQPPLERRMKPAGGG